MLKVLGYVPGRGTVRAWSSFIVPFASGPEGELVAAGALDLFGAPRAVEDLVRALTSGQELTVSGNGTELRFKLYGAAGARVRKAKIDDFVHAVVGVPAFWEVLEGGGVLAGADPAGILEYVKRKTQVPVLPEWLPSLPAVLKESMREYRVLGEPPFPLRIVRLVEDPERELRAAVREGRLPVPGGGEAAGSLAAVSSLEEYLREFAPELARKVGELAEPLRKPGDPDDPRLEQLVRRPFRAQAEAIQALVKVLERRRSAFLVGDMGTGKTYCACAAAWLVSRTGACRVLVMCPSHLVGKWKREVEATVPGARVGAIASWRDALALPAEKPRVPEFWIVSKEMAKLGWHRRPGAVWRRGRWECPRCGQVVAAARDFFREPRADNARCGRCGEPLWQADREGPRRAAVCDVIKRLPRGYFGVFVGDEAHYYKSPCSAQGRAFGVFCARAKRSLALTGTLTGGYASNLFHLLFRTSPEEMKRAGYSYSDAGKFVAAYGCLEKVVPEQNARVGRSSRKAGAAVRVRERPGISPAVFSEHLMERCVFVELSDLAADLPPYREEPLLVGMSREQEAAYAELRSALGQEVRKLLKARSARVGGYVHAALSYPDRPCGNPPVTAGGKVVAAPRDLPDWPVYPKEEALLQICREEVSRGRRVFVYLVYTGLRDVSGRLLELLSGAGLKAEVLRASVSPVEREEWIAGAVRRGVEVLLGNARLVEVGLDLIDFPTLVFYQTGYSLYTLRQASRRSWRIGQTEPVRVVFLAYRDHLQEAVLRLMGSKLRAALALEGRFSSEGLRAMAQGMDLGLELARVLAEGMEGLEPAGEMWSPPPRLVAAGPEGRQLAWEFAVAG